MASSSKAWLACCCAGLRPSVLRCSSRSAWAVLPNSSRAPANSQEAGDLTVRGWLRRDPDHWHRAASGTRVRNKLRADSRCAPRISPLLATKLAASSWASRTIFESRIDVVVSEVKSSVRWVARIRMLLVATRVWAWATSANNKQAKGGDNQRVTHGTTPEKHGITIGRELLVPVQGHWHEVLAGPGAGNPRPIPVVRLSFDHHWR